MNIVIAMDSFKGSLSSIEAGTVIKNTIEKVMPDADVRVCPSPTAARARWRHLPSEWAVRWKQSP